MRKTAKLACESEEMQIRFWEPEGRDSRRFAVGFSDVSTLIPTTFISELPCPSFSWISLICESLIRGNRLDAKRSKSQLNKANVLRKLYHPINSFHETETEAKNRFINKNHSVKRNDISSGLIYSIIDNSTKY